MASKRMKGLTYAMTAFNTLFTKDVDMAYDILKQELQMPKDAEQTGGIPVRLKNGETVTVNVGKVNAQMRNKLIEA